MASGSGRSSRTLASLTSMGRLMPASTSTFGRLHAGDREIGGCAAEHIGEDGDAIAAVDAIDRFNDITSTQIEVVLGPDRDCFDLLLWTHDVFERGLELVGKAPMGHKY